MSDDKRQRAVEALISFAHAYRFEPDSATFKAMAFIDVLTELLTPPAQPRPGGELLRSDDIHCAGCSRLIMGSTRLLFRVHV